MAGWEREDWECEREVAWERGGGKGAMETGWAKGEWVRATGGGSVWEEG